MTESYSVRLDQKRLVFCAAHFITYGEDVCEPLHGHNFHVQAEVRGPLGEHQYVVDFVALSGLLQGLVEGLDHRMLLPTKHPRIAVAYDETSVTATHGERRWLFPREDCVLLPVANTTAELLAHYLAQELLAAWNLTDALRPKWLQVSVDECDGQWGVCLVESS